MNALAEMLDDRPIADLSIANPCWGDGSQAHRTAVDTLHEVGVTTIDIAPTMVFPQLKEGVAIEDIDDDQVGDYLLTLKHSETPGGLALEVAGMQSLTYGRPESIFGDHEEAGRLRDYLGEVIGIAGKLGVSTMIFGSPNTRHITDRSEDEVLTKAVDFFGPLGSMAADHDITLGIEPVSTTWTQGRQVFGRSAVEIVDFLHELRTQGYHGVKLVPDSFAMHDAGDDISPVVWQAGADGLLAPHAQMAQPAMLPPTIEDNPLADTHHTLARALGVQWEGQGDTIGRWPVLAVEMNPQKVGVSEQNVQGITLVRTLRGIVAAARNHYNELVL